MTNNELMPYLRDRLTQSRYDAVVIGSGPNGLAAAITVAQTGRKVALLEAKPILGGGLRSAELTLPGFVHDLGSAVHPFGLASPFFRALPLERYGLRWVHPELPLAHPLDGGVAAVQRRSLEETAAGFGRDGTAYRWLFEQPVRDWEGLEQDVLAPLLKVPRRPLELARFGLRGGLPTTLVGYTLFRDEPARALLAGLAAHSVLPLSALTSTAVALVLGTLAHRVGWPSPVGGAGRLADALAAHFRTLGGEILTDAPVTRLGELPEADLTFLDVTPRQFLALTDGTLPERYRRRLSRYRYGAGIFKLDYALDGPVPWAAEVVTKAGTVHLGGTLADIAAAEGAALRGQHPERPFVLVAQQSVADSTRAPAGKHTLWAYCHVPNGSTVDMTGAIEGQLERFAPGFKKLVLARSVSAPADLERQNANLIGGDIGGGVQDWRQLLARPVLSPNPYKTPLPGVYLCSSSTPPGGGVHGMCGFNAATRALAEV